MRDRTRRAARSASGPPQRANDQRCRPSGGDAPGRIPPRYARAGPDLVVGRIRAFIGASAFGLLGISAGGWIGSIDTATIGPRGPI